MKRLNLVLFAVVFILIDASGTDIAEKVKIQNENVVKAAAEEFSKDLPKRVDRFTKLVAVSPEGEKLLYIFEIEVPGKSDEEIAEEGEKKMKRRVVAGTCGTSKRFLKSGIILSYRYVSAATKRTLFDIDVKESDCLKITTDTEASTD